MRYFLSGRLPQVTSILLVESGTRGLLEGLIPGLRQAWGDQINIDLVTCYATLPKGFEAHNTRLFRIGDYRGYAAQKRLFRELSSNNYALVGILCSGEVVMAKWKWVIAMGMAAKVFIINENGDYFWFDRMHLGAIRQFVLYRSVFGDCAPKLLTLVGVVHGLAYHFFARPNCPTAQFHTPDI